MKPQCKIKTQHSDSRHREICLRQASHTPTPSIDLYQDGTDYPAEFLINRLGISHDRAAFIVRAVNCHEELIGELKSLVAWVEENPSRAESLERQLNNAKAAIAKAEAK